MDLNEKFQKDLKEAMKNGDTVTVGVLRLLRTRLKEALVAKKRQDLSQEEIYRIIVSEVNKRKEAIDLFKKGGREDLAQRELKEIEVLESYLPPRLSEEELRSQAMAAIEEVGASSPKDLGKVMKVLMPRVTGRADGSVVNKIVRELLAQKRS